MWPVTSHVIMKIKINTLETLPSCVYGSVDLYELNSYITTETDELKSEAKKGDKNTTGIITITCLTREWFAYMVLWR